MKCGKCRFFDPMDDAFNGWCRRYAPRPIRTNFEDDDHDPDNDAYWPEVCIHDWCGEFQAKGDE